MVKFCIFDTSSLIRFLRSPSIQKNILGSLSDNCQIVITSLVDRELRDRESRLLLDSLKWNVQIVDPPRKFMDKARNSAKEFGGMFTLSEADISVIGLALYFSQMYGSNKVIVFSEDFDIQNMLALHNIKFGSVQGKVIKRILKFKKKCVMCGTVYNAELVECPNCGSKEFKVVVEKNRD
ncbi:MAG: hypothetical protein ACP6IP_06085 [Candidatus Njordarchaeia archaeon]